MFESESFGEKKAIFCTLIFVLFLLLFAAVFYSRFSMLQKSKEPTGLDGYYYALQAKSLVQTGSLENPDTATGFYLCGLCSAISGDAIKGCKIWASIASSIFCLGSAFLVFSFSKNIFLSVVSFILAAISPSAITLSINYINNLTALAFFSLAAGFLIFAVKNFKTLSLSSRIILFAFSALFFILAAITHLVALIYSAVLIFVLFINSKIFVFENKKIRAGSKIFVAFLFVLFLISLKIELPRFASMFSFGPVLPCFSSFMKKSISFWLLIEQSADFFLVWIVSIVFAFIFKSFRKGISVLISSLVLFFPFWNLSVLDMGYRLFLSGSAVSWNYIFCLLFFIFKRINFVYFSKKSVRISMLCIYFALVLSGFFILVFKSGSIYNVKKDPPYVYYRKVIKNINLDDDSLLIAHLGINHVYTYYKNLRWALNYLPDFPVEKEKLWRLAFGADRDEIIHVLEESGDEIPDERAMIRRIDENYILILEDLWQKYLLNEDQEIAQTFNNWFNPYTYRPKFIRK